MILGLIYALAGAYGPATAKVLNALLGAAVSVLTASMAEILSGSRSTGYLSGFLTAVYPQYVYYATVVASENAAVFFLVLVSWLMVRYFLNHRLSLAFAAGLFLGLASLVRPAALFYLLIPPAWMLLLRVNVRKLLTAAGVFLSGVLLIVLPWITVNSIHAGQLVFIAPNGGINLLIGNHTGAPGHYVWPVPGFDTEGLNLVELDRKARTCAIRHIINHPYQFALLSIKKLRYLMAAGLDGTEWSTRKTARKVSQSIKETAARLEIYTFKILKWLVLAGAVLSLRRPSSWHHLLVLLAYAGLIVVFFGSSRFRLMINPYALSFAAYAVVFAFQTAKKRWSRRADLNR